MTRSFNRLYLCTLFIIVSFILTGCSPNTRSVVESANVLTILQTPSVKNTAFTTDINSIQPMSLEKTGDSMFTTVSETVYAIANVNIRSSASTAENNIVAVLKKDSPVKRIGYNNEWSKVLYKGKACYIKTNYLTLKKPTPSATTTPDSNRNDSTASLSPEEAAVAKLTIAAKTDQLVLVIGSKTGTSSTVSYYTKDTKGIWHQQFSVKGDIGSKGITYDKKEGDIKTPAGMFSFTLAFGLKPDPGTVLSYRKITKYDYWVDDVHSPYYNTWVNKLTTPGDYRSEHLIDHNPSYNYALHINYNPDNTPGLGSAIFLHGYNGSGHTTGCIALPEKYVKLLVQKVKPKAKIIIVPSSKYLSKY